VAMGGIQRGLAQLDGRRRRHRKICPEFPESE
jgi:hypothetical protein